MMHPFQWTYLVVVLFFASCTDAESSPGVRPADECVTSADRPPSYPELSFFERWTLGQHINYQVATSVSDLASRSDVVVEARFGDIQRGRTLHAPRCEIAGGHTSAGTLLVERVVRGDPKEPIVVQMDHSRVVSAAHLREKIPDDRFLFFLLKAERFPPSSSFDEGAGVPAGAVLYLLNTPLGIISGSDGRITFPFEANARNWIQTNHSSLDAISAEIGSP